MFSRCEPVPTCRLFSHKFLGRRCLGEGHPPTPRRQRRRPSAASLGSRANCVHAILAENISMEISRRKSPVDATNLENICRRESLEADLSRQISQRSPLDANILREYIDAILPKLISRRKFHDGKYRRKYLDKYLDANISTQISQRKPPDAHSLRNISRCESLDANISTQISRQYPLDAHISRQYLDAHLST